MIVKKLQLNFFLRNSLSLSLRTTCVQSNLVFLDPLLYKWEEWSRIQISPTFKDSLLICQFSSQVYLLIQKATKENNVQNFTQHCSAMNNIRKGCVIGDLLFALITGRGTCSIYATLTVNSFLNPKGLVSFSIAFQRSILFFNRGKATLHGDSFAHNWSKAVALLQLHMHIHECTRISLSLVLYQLFSFAGFFQLFQKQGLTTSPGLLVMVHLWL